MRIDHSNIPGWLYNIVPLIDGSYYIQQQISNGRQFTTVHACMRIFNAAIHIIHECMHYHRTQLFIDPCKYTEHVMLISVTLYNFPKNNSKL